jgi:hypothetical protein
VQGNDYRGTPRGEWAEIAFFEPGALGPGPASVFGSSPPYAKILGIAYKDDTNTMGQHAYPRWLALALFAAAALAWAAPSARAASVDYCVTCKNPDEVYRCRVAGVGSKPSDALKLYCVIRLAKEGKHASCAAEAATASCVGLIKVYNYNGPTLPENITSDSRVRELEQKVERNQRDFAKPEGKEPKSLFELGGRAVSASKRGLRNASEAVGLSSSESQTPRPAAQPLPTKHVGTATRMKQAAQSAGAAVGGFARRSYNCMLSLFRHCGE